ncbi:Peptidoglycan-binding lysin domain [Desulfurobacterium thermolithotrophum DSM 11699]|uniref:Peptidoglycan-binding lysin domain n=1 Tax=Desulfurobacterium thermolithotrophum (strain DSM 11699 / BSA) TaxID=868864 RepID=F0S386_DESTD|nr:LysM peptidoglycan-binding domain-containing protein [Desulfurobacterium thermolithotrophum]ADY73308.1 Peptidoglycan-binding lysin domain [Desulfurobacterium thermolithotrophum DSM 11699]
MKKLIAVLSITLIAGISNVQAGCPKPVEEYILYPPDFAFYPESLFKAYKEAKAEHKELLSKLEKCKKELELLKAKKAELEERYSTLNTEIEKLKREIAERESLIAELQRLEKLSRKKVNKCEELIRKWESLPKSYIVKKGDTLWGIAAKDFIYGDPWQWPLIFKANRDKIKNPHLIFPKQELEIPRDINCQDIIEARREALKTPPPPGVKPKKVGPVKAEEVPQTATDYFLCKEHTMCKKCR